MEPMREKRSNYHPKTLSRPSCRITGPAEAFQQKMVDSLKGDLPFVSFVDLNLFLDAPVVHAKFGSDRT